MRPPPPGPVGIPIVADDKRRCCQPIDTTREDCIMALLCCIVHLSILSSALKRHGFEENALLAARKGPPRHFTLHKLFYQMNRGLRTRNRLTEIRRPRPVIRFASALPLPRKAVAFAFVTHGRILCSERKRDANRFILRSTGFIFRTRKHLVQPCVGCCL
ncbi:hypothetical protein LSTR_LSTR011673 [Laodelphax striatellus]|uniref:Uncharacterized protein n=1 Tax=Laodelphax striatellus TaxID=195883 RepID=A0A482WU66_LAOST|nr:hypothetical protein LSTR_LSTR015345 [Laodelphax striatellus]RZF37396.1 hypothetical protein LSTR_LSTR011673 [Laodelphax striatellus]